MPVIILTSKDEEIDEILGFNLGRADDYMHKPFSQRLLIERVKAVLRRAGVEGEEPQATAARGGRRSGRSRHQARQADPRSGPARLPLGRQAGEADGDGVPAPCSRWRNGPAS